MSTLPKLRGYLDCATRPMHTGESHHMIQCMMMAPNAVPESELLKIQGTRLIVGRLAWCGLEGRVDHSVILFCGAITGIPGELTMWALTLALLAEKNGRCSFDEFVFAFPNGLPTDEARRAAWGGQKDGSANRIDRREEWPMPAEKGVA